MNLKKILSALVAGTMAMSAMVFSVSADELPGCETEMLFNVEVKNARPMTNPTGNEFLDDFTLDFAMRFTATEGSAVGKAYEKYNADFTLTFDKPVTAKLAGEYGGWGWIAIVDPDDTIDYPSAEDDRLGPDGYKFKAGETIRVLEAYGVTMTYSEVLEWVQVFTCGVEIIEGDPDVVPTLDLNLYETYIDSTGSLVENKEADPIKVDSYNGGVSMLSLEAHDDDPAKYDLVLSSEDKGVIQNFVSGEFTVDFTAQDTAGNDIDDSVFDYEIISANDETTISYINNDNGTRKYKVYLDEFHKDGANKSWTANADATEFTLGTLVINSTATGTIDLKDIVMNRHDDTAENLAVEMKTNPGGAVVFDTLDPTHDLTINVTFNNKINENDCDYQDMKVTVSGGDLHEDMVFDLGTNGDADLNDKVYTVVAEDLTQGRTYNVKVEGAGYRTATYSVAMTEAKTLNFWNNVKDVAEKVEVGNAASEKNVTFLAGDIVKDNIINVYDLSAVVSYFGMVDLSANNNAKYVMYDLNRDTKIDSRDVAYVLVSWNK